MPDEPKPDDSPMGWNVTLKEHLEAIAELERRFDAERDRRYSEVNIEREKALKIKEAADLAALELAREIQSYKDEKANQLREQINGERGNYANKSDLENLKKELLATIKPLSEYVSSQQGRSSGLDAGWKILLAIIGALASIVTIISILNLFYAKHP